MPSNICHPVEGQGRAKLIFPAYNLPGETLIFYTKIISWCYIVAHWFPI